MIAYVKTDGSIHGVVYGTSVENLDGITMLHDADYAMFLDDTQYADVNTNSGEYTITNIVVGQPNKNNIPTATGTVTHTPIPDSTKLANAQQAKIAQLRQSLENAIATFTSSALGTTNTYLGDQTSMTFLGAEYSYIRSADYKGETIQYYTREQGRVAHTGEQLAQVFLDGRTNATNQYAHYDSLVSQVKAVTITTTLQDALNQINAITW